MYSFGKSSLAKLKGVAPKLVSVMMEAIITSPFDFTITDGVRSINEQRALYAQGRTKPGPIVTQRDGVRLKSNHQPKDNGYGYAVDIYPYVDGKIDFNDRAGRMNKIADNIKRVAAKQGVKVIWGGDWTVAHDGLVDRPHFELRT